MKHIELQIIATPQQQEELIALLDEQSAAGFEQTDEVLKAYFAESNFSREEIYSIVSGYQFSVSELEEQNWNAVWEENFQPVVVGDFCAVRAHFHPPIEGVAHQIVITPKMSFGTGHHATTYMMMQQMRDIDFRGKKVFDFGTGTGILAILAEKLGAENIVGIDVDDWSIENAAENFERNGCSKASVLLTSNLPDEVFDILLANINRNVILAYMKQLVSICSQGGLILFSGLLITDESAIREAAENEGLVFMKQTSRSGWVSLLFVNQR